jgi:hypothetical protein
MCLYLKEKTKAPGEKPVQCHCPLHNRAWQKLSALFFPVSCLAKAVVWVFPNYAWHSLEEVFPITGISPKSVTEQRQWFDLKSMQNEDFWLCGFESSWMWRSFIPLFPTFDETRCLPRATPSEKKTTHRRTNKKIPEYSSTPPWEPQISQHRIFTFPPVWISPKLNCNFHYGFFLSISKDISLPLYTVH